MFSGNESWNALFSSLALAEKAAANECQKIADQFRAEGNESLAAEYDALVLEENHHGALAGSVVKNLIPITDRAAAVYNGEFFSENASALERLTSVHLVFEPSALAFLGYVSAHSHELISDRTWAKEISSAFNKIIKDEVSHVADGANLIRQFWNSATEEERQCSLKTMRKHRAFLKAGLQSFFKNKNSKPEFVQTMLNRFDFYYERALKGAFYEEAAQVAS